MACSMFGHRSGWARSRVSCANVNERGWAVRDGRLHDCSARACTGHPVRCSSLSSGTLPPLKRRHVLSSEARGAGRFNWGGGWAVCVCSRVCWAQLVAKAKPCLLLRLGLAPTTAGHFRAVEATSSVSKWRHNNAGHRSFGKPRVHGDLEDTVNPTLEDSYVRVLGVEGSAVSIIFSLIPE